MESNKQTTESVSTLDKTTTGKRSTGDIAHDFGSESTFHGIKYVTDPKLNVFRRFVWILVIFGALTRLAFNVVQSLTQFYKYPKSTLVTVNHVPDLDFPAVTLCNFNQLQKSKLDRERLVFLKAAFGITAQQEQSINWTAVNPDLLPSFDVLLNATHRMEDMMISCLWLGVEPCTAKDFEMTITDWGLCYTFNDRSNRSNILKVNQPGSINGLFLRLNTQQDEYIDWENSAAGFKVLLHPQGVRPLVRELGFSVSPGFETSVSISTKEVTNLRYPYSVPDCVYQDKSDNITEVYTYAGCLQKCKEEYVINRCKCKVFQYQGTAPLCNPRMLIECIQVTEAEFIRNNLHVDCNECSEPCHSRTYSVRLSQAYFPNDYIRSQMSMQQNISTEYFRKNFLDLRLYFEEISYESVSQVEAYTSNNLQSDIGGSMGLLVGMSIISVVEFIDFLIIIMWSKLSGA